jgi:hypothetical protein
MPKAMGSAPHRAASVVIMMGAKAQDAGFANGLGRRHAVMALRCLACRRPRKRT